MLGAPISFGTSLSSMLKRETREGEATVDVTSDPSLPCSNSGWELPSNTGQETCRWSVQDAEGEGDARVFLCCVRLEGRFFDASLGGTAIREERDYALEIRGLQVRVDELARLTAHLGEWLRLPLPDMRSTALELSCGMGGLFDQSLRLTLGARKDTISGGHPVATLDYIIGRMKGELSYPVDPTCLQKLVDGIDRVLAS